MPKPCFIFYVHGSLTEKWPNRIKMLINWSESWVTRMVRAGALLGESGGAGPSQPGPETAVGAPHQYLPVSIRRLLRRAKNFTTMHNSRLRNSCHQLKQQSFWLHTSDRKWQGHPCEKRETSFVNLVSA